MTKKEVALIRRTIESLAEELAGTGDFEGCGPMWKPLEIADRKARMDVLGWLLEATGNEDSLPEFMKEESVC